MKRKIALVTGASRGIGKSVAIHLASINYYVILLARNEQELKIVNQQILDAGGYSSHIAIDVSDNTQVKNCIQQIITQHGHIDLLFNNAAVLQRGTTDVSDEAIKKLIEINLNGAIYVAKYVAQQMKNQRDGYIINVSSLGGKVAMPFSGIYAASKFGLSGYTESLSKEMSVYDVKVTNICPSMVATEMAVGRKFALDQIIQTDDIIKTVDYLLSLSKNAIPMEITISCLPLIAKMTEIITELYLK